MKLQGEIFHKTAWAILFRPRGLKEAWVARSMLQRMEIQGEGKPPWPAIIHLPRRLARRKFGVK